MILMQIHSESFLRRCREQFSDLSTGSWATRRKRRVAFTSSQVEERNGGMMVTEHLLLGTSSSVDTVQRDKTNISLTGGFKPKTSSWWLAIG